MHYCSVLALFRSSIKEQWKKKKETLLLCRNVHFRCGGVWIQRLPTSGAEIHGKWLSQKDEGIIIENSDTKGCVTKLWRFMWSKQIILSYVSTYWRAASRRRFLRPQVGEGRRLDLWRQLALSFASPGLPAAASRWLVLLYMIVLETIKSFFFSSQT